MCLQYGLFSQKLRGNEDCLYLNVFTPEVRRITSLFFLKTGKFQDSPRGDEAQTRDGVVARRRPRDGFGKQETSRARFPTDRGRGAGHA